MDIFTSEKFVDMIITTVIPMLAGFYGAYYIYKKEQTTMHIENETEDMFFIASLLTQLDYNLNLLLDEALEFQGREREYWQYYKANPYFEITGISKETSYLDTIFIYEQIENYMLLYPNLCKYLELIDESLNSLIVNARFTDEMTGARDINSKTDFHGFMALNRSGDLVANIEECLLVTKIFKNYIYHRVYNDLSKNSIEVKKYIQENEKLKKELEDSRKEAPARISRIQQRTYDIPWFMKLKHNGVLSYLEDIETKLFIFYADHEEYFIKNKNLDEESEKTLKEGLVGLASDKNYKTAVSNVEKIRYLKDLSRDHVKSFDKFMDKFAAFSAAVEQINMAMGDINPEAFEKHYSFELMQNQVSKLIHEAIIATGVFYEIIENDWDEDSDSLLIEEKASEIRSDYYDRIYDEIAQYKFDQDFDWGEFYSNQGY